MNRILIILLAFLSISCFEKIHAQQVSSPSEKLSPSYKKQTITYKLIEANNHTYGYNIFINDTLFIHQPVIPCLAGNKGFKTKADAKKVAALVIEKIGKHMVPPSVSVTEMKMLGVRF